MYVLLIGSESAFLEQARKSEGITIQQSSNNVPVALGNEERQKLLNENARLKERVRQLELGNAGTQSAANAVKVITVAPTSTFETVVV